jgi:hypothetical protein
MAFHFVPDRVRFLVAVWPCGRVAVSFRESVVTVHHISRARQTVRSHFLPIIPRMHPQVEPVAGAVASGIECTRLSTTRRSQRVARDSPARVRDLLTLNELN